MLKGKNLRKTSNLKPRTTLTATKRINKSGKTSISKLKKEADRVHSIATRLRFSHKENGEWITRCITCPVAKEIKKMQCGHFMSRSHNATRYSRENTGGQCYGDNIMHQGKQYVFGLEIDKLYGAGTAERLYREAQVPHRFTIEELEAIIEDRKKEIDSYGYVM